MKKYTKHHPEFWIKQGFTLEEAKIKSLEYSIWFKENRINKNSITYWIKQGLSEEEAKIEIRNYKETKTKKFNRYSVEEQMNRYNLTEEEAIQKVKNIKESQFNIYSIKHQMNKFNLTEEEAKNKIEIIKLSNNIWLNKSEEEAKEIKNKIGKTVKDNFNKMSDFDFKSMSWHNKEYWIKKGLSEEEAVKRAYETTEKNRNKMQILRKENPKKYSELNDTSIKYWLNKGLNREEAEKALKERQNTFSLEKCILKYGKELGTEKFNERQRKWHQNYTKSSYSMISQELFVFLIEKMKNKNKNECRFATFLNGKILKKEEQNNKNWEKTIKTKDGCLFPDFIYENKIIEFDGVYYHKNNIENKKREKIRDQRLINEGYKVLHIREDEYKKDKESIIQKCLVFLELNDNKI